MHFFTIRRVQLPQMMERDELLEVRDDLEEY